VGSYNEGFNGVGGIKHVDAMVPPYALRLFAVRKPVVTESSATSHARQVRIGGVTYLNARPLTAYLAQFIPAAQLSVNLPSRLADALAAGRLDVALVPSIEYFRNPGYAIVSDACVACRGPVQSVKLYSRVPVDRIRTLALDEGSRTSAALARILLRERFGVEPQIEAFPIGNSLEQSTADATLLIGDRAMRASETRFAFIWDLGQEWWQWTGLPFVFALWTARPATDTEPNVALRQIGKSLSAARDEGVAHLAEIAQNEAPTTGISEAQCLAYFRDHLKFHLGLPERQGLQRFAELAARNGLAPAGVSIVFHDREVAR
jgi:chorismate dehydratase